MVVRKEQNQLPKSLKTDLFPNSQPQTALAQRWESLFDLLDFLRVAQSDVSGLQLL